jgi:hypothetical protein
MVFSPLIEAQNIVDVHEVYLKNILQEKLFLTDLFEKRENSFL